MVGLRGAGPCQVVTEADGLHGNTKDQHGWMAGFEGDAQETKGRISRGLQRSG